ncbi:MAG: SDR family oxidoreductase [Deltaproteobacteria bacterium]|nr:SDR family oxidoreductase [Deltaproteobacteria bacterium]MBN2673092.1 SDR family oxidoreductase [Deltaproteobacteria bacterium]
MSIDLSGKTALITGATGQLGRVMVQTLAQCGADVIIHYKHNQKHAAVLRAEIEALGVRGFVATADVGEYDSMMAMKAEIESNFKLPDIVVTNAVTQIFPWKTVLEEEVEDYDNQFKSCVMQNVHAAKAFVPHMVAQKWGRVIGINTEVSIQTYETQSAYAAGKKGMDGVLRVLAREVGPDGVTVNQVAPGWTISYKDRQKGTEIQESYAKTVPLRRRGEDSEIANVVAFLGSDLASFITGAFIPVNGGNTFVGV